MKIKAEQLQRELQKELLPIYLVSGDEPLLVMESCDQIRAAARDADYLERQIMHADKMDWDHFRAETQSLSLFASRRIIEVRLNNGKAGTEGSSAFVDYCKQPAEDTLLLVVAGKLESSQRNSKWVKALESAGGHIQVWPIKPKQMPHWIREQMQMAGIDADRQAIDILADRVEGNLLAARQEIEKLKLLTDGRIDAQIMSNVVADSARFDVFTLVDRCLAGEAVDAYRTLLGLREEGNEPLTILWAMAREIRVLLTIEEATRNGQSFQTACKNARVWESRQHLLRTALNHLSINKLRLALRHCRVVDQIAKGARKGDAWLELQDLTLNLCGQPVRDRETMKLALQG